MLPKLVHTIVLLVSILLASSQAQNQDLSIDLRPYRIVETEDENGDIQEQLVLADSAEPGEQIVYQLLLRNNSNSPKDSVVAAAPIPVGTHYIANSATHDDSFLRLEFSLDGETFAPEPLYMVIEDEDGERQVEANPSDYRALRWLLLRPLRGEEVLELHYRVTVQ